MTKATELSRAVRNREGLRYSPELRRRLLDYVRDGRRNRVGWARLSRTLSVPQSTLFRWFSDDVERVCVVPVRSTVAAPIQRSMVAAVVANAPQLSLVSPSGWRVVDLTISEAAQLLRELHQ